MNESSIILTKLKALGDETYRSFQSKLIPEIDPSKIIGVRMPALKKLSVEICGSEEASEFLRQLPHYYYDEDNLHAYLIMREKNFDTALKLTEEFLPYINNWATCDSLKPSVFSKKPETLLPQVKSWLKSGHPFTVRYGIKFLMDYFLDRRFDESYLKLISDVENDSYYVKMASAWYFSFALIKQYEKTVTLFKKGLPDRFVHNKAIQKATESRRLSPDEKNYLRTLKIR